MNNFNEIKTLEQFIDNFENKVFGDVNLKEKVPNLLMLVEIGEKSDITFSDLSGSWQIRGNFKSGFVELLMSIDEAPVFLTTQEVLLNAL